MSRPMLQHPDPLAPMGSGTTQALCLWEEVPVPSVFPLLSLPPTAICSNQAHPSLALQGGYGTNLVFVWDLGEKWPPRGQQSSRPRASGEGSGAHWGAQPSAQTLTVRAQPVLLRGCAAPRCLKQPGRRGGGTGGWWQEGARGGQQRLLGGCTAPRCDASAHSPPKGTRGFRGLLQIWSRASDKRGKPTVVSWHLWADINSYKC